MGIVRSKRAPSAMHPYGYLKDKFVWSLISAVGIFCLGAGVTVMHGFQSLFIEKQIEHMMITGAGNNAEWSHALLSFGCTRSGLQSFSAPQCTVLAILPGTSHRGPAVQMTPCSMLCSGNHRQCIHARQTQSCKQISCHQNSISSTSSLALPAYIPAPAPQYHVATALFLENSHTVVMNLVRRLLDITLFTDRNQHIDPHAAAVLGFSTLLEGYSLLVAIRTVTAGAASHGLPFMEFVRRGMDPTSIAVMMEDGAAVAGLGIAGNTVSVSVNRIQQLKGPVGITAGLHYLCLCGTSVTW